MIAILKIISRSNHINIENRNCIETYSGAYQRDNVHLKTNVTGKAMSVLALIRIKIIFSLLFSHTHAFYSLHFLFSFHCFLLLFNHSKGNEHKLSIDTNTSCSLVHRNFSLFNSAMFLLSSLNKCRLSHLAILSFVVGASVCSTYCYEKKKTQDQTCNQDEWMSMFGCVIFT